MKSASPNCALLADRHTVLTEGIRDLLETTFETVYVVADTRTLREGASRLLPTLIVLDLSLAGCGSSQVVEEVRGLAPASRLLVLTVHDEAIVARTAIQAGAHGVVLKRCIGSEFMLAVDALLQGKGFVSPDIGLN